MLRFSGSNFRHVADILTSGSGEGKERGRENRPNDKTPVRLSWEMMQGLGEGRVTHDRQLS